MSTHKICDTNVFRNLAFGDLDLAVLTSDGSTIYYSPATVLELISRFTEGSFEHRKQTATAIVDSGAIALPDPEAYLTRDVFGFQLNEDDFDWSQAVSAISQSSSIDDLQRGVPDYVVGVRRKVNLSYARQYRDNLDKQFVQDMLDLQQREIPGFSAWWNPDPSKRKGQVPVLPKHLRLDFLRYITTPQGTADVIEACRQRAMFKTNDAVPWPPTKEWVNRLGIAVEKLACYKATYHQYLRQLLTGRMLARANDWWDLEMMLYSSDDDHVVVTAEKKWKSLASDGGFGHRIIVAP